MAIKTVLLTTFLANAFVAANNAISDTPIDGGAANAVSCLPAFLRKDTSFEGKVKNLAKGLEAQMGPHADLAEQTITNAKDIVEHGTPKGFKELLKQEGLDEDTLWKAFLKQPKAKKLYDDADATTRPHTEWLVKQGLKLWLDERIQNGALERFHLELSFDTNQTVHRSEGKIDNLQSMVEKLVARQAAQTLQILQAQLEALTNDDPEVLAKRDAAEKALDDGQFDLAEALLEEAEKIDAARIEDVERDVLRPRRESQAKSAYTLALLAESQINFQDAYTHALRAHELAPDNYDYLFLAQNRAFDAGDYQKGLELGEEMMARTTIDYGEQSKEYANACNQTAVCAEDLGDLDKAELLFRRAIEIGEKTLEPNNLNLASGLNNLANLLRKKGDLEKAEPLYRRAIEIGEETLDSNHPKIAIRLNNLANLLLQKGDLDEAEQLYRRNIKINEETLGPNHPNLATSLNNLAILFKDKGAFDAAEPLYQRAITILENAFPHGHPNLDEGRKNYAIMQAKRDQQ